jgi:hypothetical protein
MRDRRGLLLPTGGPLFGRPIYPGNGYPPRPGEDRPGLSAFGRLAMGQTLGKSSILIYNHEIEVAQQAGVDMMTVEGDDLDSQQLVVTLHPPRVIALSIEQVRERLDQQNLSGEQLNSEVSPHCFPGTTKPIQWPPLEAAIEFGTGGVSTTAIVDYTNGVTLTVQASYLRAVALISQTKRSGAIFGTSAAYYLAAHVGPGFAESHAQRTIFVGEVDHKHESDVFDVPKFAKVGNLIGTRPPHHGKRHRPSPAVGWVRFYQSPDGTNPVADSFLGNHEATVEVPNAGLYFSVFNESGHRMKMAVIFELSL